jgi:hypothetical protein
MRGRDDRVREELAGMTKKRRTYEPRVFRPRASGRSAGHPGGAVASFSISLSDALAEYRFNHRELQAAE